MPDKCKGRTKPKGLTLLMEKSAWPPLSVQARSDMCEKRMPITHCNLQTNVSIKLHNSHQLEKFPTAANYASKPG